MRPGADAGTVYLCCQPVDFRKSISGLAVLVEQALGLDPFAHALYVFTNKERNRVKLLYWERNGFCKPSTKDPRHQIRTSAALLSMASLVRT